MPLNPYGDNVVPVVPVDYPIHNDEHPNCSDFDCPCYDDLKGELTEQYQEGLVSADDATRILQGRQIWQ